MAAYRLLRGTPVSPIPGTFWIRSRAGLSKSGPQAELLGNAPERAKAMSGSQRKRFGNGAAAAAVRLLRKDGASWWLRSFLTGHNKLVFCADEMQVFSGRRDLAGVRF